MVSGAKFRSWLDRTVCEHFITRLSQYSDFHFNTENSTRIPGSFSDYGLNYGPVYVHTLQLATLLERFIVKQQKYFVEISQIQNWKVLTYNLSAYTIQLIQFDSSN